jgi:hypothetical protein
VRLVEAKRRPIVQERVEPDQGVAVVGSMPFGEGKDFFRVSHSLIFRVDAQAVDDEPFVVGVFPLHLAVFRRFFFVERDVARKLIAFEQPERVPLDDIARDVRGGRIDFVPLIDAVFAHFLYRVSDEIHCRFEMSGFQFPDFAHGLSSFRRLPPLTSQEAPNAKSMIISSARIM